jgi:tetratricopeptide (TPR) repeat protein
MKYREYVEAVQHAAKLVEGGDHETAISLFRGLLARDISDVDKAMICLNIAIVLDKLGRPEEALSWYGTGADYEHRHARHFVAERRAAYLAEKGRHHESLALYRELLGRPALTEEDKERIRQNIELLQRRSP